MIILFKLNPQVQNALGLACFHQIYLNANSFLFLWSILVNSGQLALPRVPAGIQCPLWFTTSLQNVYLIMSLFISLFFSDALRASDQKLWDLVCFPVGKTVSWLHSVTGHHVLLHVKKVILAIMWQIWRKKRSWTSSHFWQNVYTHHFLTEGI